MLYVARGQTSEREILANSFGSSRYLEFLKGLGSLLRLPDVPPRMVYLGGLDQSGTDGKVTYCYHDTISQVIYHVATLMPTDLTSDPVCSCKKLHIGNDFVTIVYNDSGSEYKFGTLKVWASELMRVCFVLFVPFWYWISSSELSIDIVVCNYLGCKLKLLFTGYDDTVMYFIS